MSTPAKRLDAVTTSLTARERARIAMRWWCEGREDVDRRIADYMPPEQKEEFERVVLAIEHANNEFYEVLTFTIEWTNQTDVRLGWLISLDALLNRCDELTMALNERGVRVVEEGPRPPRNAHHLVIVRALPDAAECFRDDLPHLWGRTIDNGVPTPTNWTEARAKLLRDVQDDLRLRWRELAAMDRVFAELAAVMGEPMLHVSIATAAGLLRAKVLQLHSRLQRIGASFPLPDPTDDDIRPAATAVPDRREWMAPGDRADLEAAEADWAESLG